ncbi:MAG: DUF433 domain-containing protein [Candidatus Brockarchaeota archaeon]|nr:DUF433 domain-containing protein [Candidatus Brockarchaeota archaeon]
MRVEINEYIVIDSEICHGKATFRETRIMVWQVLEMLKAGYRFEDILREFPTLTVEHIKAALDFAAKKLAGESLVPA